MTAAAYLLSMQRTVISVPWGGSYPPPTGIEADVVSRDVDWGMSPVRRRVQHIVGSLGFVWRARQSARLVVCAAGGPLLVIAVTKRLIAPRTELVAVDFLRPPRIPAWVLRRVVLLVDRFVVVRSGDIEILAGLGYPRDRCRFVPFPAPDLSSFTAIGDPVRRPAFVYSGGAAQRDWKTLFDALGRCGVPAVVSCPEPVEGVPANVTQVGIVMPEEGRSLLAESEFLVMAIRDNDLPSGPLLLLDAFALGRCVVATDTNGTRDYIRDGENGILVPPGDSKALGDAVRVLFESPGRMASMSRAARCTATQLTAERFWSRALE